MFITDEENDDLTNIEIFYGIISCIIIENGFKSCKEFFLNTIIPNIKELIEDSFKDISVKTFNFNEATEYEIECKINKQKIYSFIK